MCSFCKRFATTTGTRQDRRQFLHAFLPTGVRRVAREFVIGSFWLSPHRGVVPSANPTTSYFSTVRYWSWNCCDCRERELASNGISMMHFSCSHSNCRTRQSPGIVKYGMHYLPGALLGMWWSTLTLLLRHRIPIPFYFLKPR